ncbi:MAG: DUF1259 domain-containing protein [Rhizobacter sp.]|nr:DUF1259 domain-containing protein [Rhizobacter sp.]
MPGEEVNPVIYALRANGIEVTALHSHMLNEQPRLFFMHFWANDDAMKLAKGLRAWGAAAAAIATFLPCYLFTVIPAPYFKRHGKRPAIVAFVD